jgi:micrococcal nuclease
VQVGGRDETVRLLGIDTPELHKPATPVECGARAAARAMERLADGRKVELVSDPSQDERDRYGRLLAYAVTSGGTDLGEAIVRRGWAEVYVFDRPFDRLAEYRVAASAARRADRGVAAECHGDFHSAS